MARLKDKWDQKVVYNDQIHKCDVVVVTMTEGAMFGKVRSSRIPPIEVVKRKDDGVWEPIFGSRAKQSSKEA